MTAFTLVEPPPVPAQATPEAPASPALRAAHVPADSIDWVAWAAAFFLVLGSVVFLAGGRVHPAIGATAGGGPDDFFRAFAAKVVHTHGWHAMHMLILIGPLCWAVGAPTLVDGIASGARSLTSAARSALGLSAALWAVAFVLDGFGAPVYASAIEAGDGSAATAGAMTSFQANAIMMSRLGLVSWVAGGLGMAMLGGELLSPGVRTRWRVAVGLMGIMIGAWPLLAALQGEYAGGPFTSQYWRLNAIVVSAWHVALASCAFGGRPLRTATRRGVA